jgi:hypothetical protein
VEAAYIEALEALTQQDARHRHTVAP